MDRYLVYVGISVWLLYANTCYSFLSTWYSTTQNFGFRHLYGGSAVSGGHTIQRSVVRSMLPWVAQMPPDIGVLIPNGHLVMVTAIKDEPRYWNLQWILVIAGNSPRYLIWSYPKSTGLFGSGGLPLVDIWTHSPTTPGKPWISAETLSGRSDISRSHPKWVLSWGSWEPFAGFIQHSIGWKVFM